MTSTQVVYYCAICEVNVAIHKGWEHHIQGRYHQQMANGARMPTVNVAPQTAISTASATACDLCQVELPSHVWDEHLNTLDHKLREQHSRYMAALEQSETDKNGVFVEGSFDFEFIDPPAARVGKELTAAIKASSRFVLLEANLASAQGKSRGVSS